MAARRFELVPLWGIAVFLVYAMRRVACSSCGVRVERVHISRNGKDRAGRGLDEIADWFETLAKAERSHANRFQKALNSLDE